MSPPLNWALCDNKGGLCASSEGWHKWDFTYHHRVPRDPGPRQTRKQEDGPGTVAVQLRLWVCIHGSPDNKPSFAQDGRPCSNPGREPTLPGCELLAFPVLSNKWHSEAILPGTEQPDRTLMTQKPPLASPVKTKEAWAASLHVVQTPHLMRARTPHLPPRDTFLRASQARAAPVEQQTCPPAPSCFEQSSRAQGPASPPWERKRTHGQMWTSCPSTQRQRGGRAAQPHPEGNHRASAVLAGGEISPRLPLAVGLVMGQAVAKRKQAVCVTRTEVLDAVGFRTNWGFELETVASLTKKC